jgi:hypothetical protein
VEKNDCPDETGEQSEPERLAKRIAAIKLARPTRHRNSSDELLTDDNMYTIDDRM